MNDDNKRKRGPKPERVNIDEDWEDAIRKAVKKKPPKDKKSGWETDNPAPNKPRNGD